MFNRATYRSGDAWTTPEFLTRASSSPRIALLAVAPEDATPGSYFECREYGTPRTVQISVFPQSPPGGSFSVVLERRQNADDAWRTVETYTGATEKEIPYTAFYQLRLRLVSGSNINLRLFQET